MTYELGVCPTLVSECRFELGVAASVARPTLTLGPAHLCMVSQSPHKIKQWIQILLIHRYLTRVYWLLACDLYLD